MWITASRTVTVVLLHIVGLVVTPAVRLVAARTMGLMARAMGLMAHTLGLMARNHGVDGTNHGIDGMNPGIDGTNHGIDSMNHGIDGMNLEIDGTNYGIDGGTIKGLIDGTNHGIDGSTTKGLMARDMGLVTARTVIMASRRFLWTGIMASSLAFQAPRFSNDGRRLIL